ncbi:MAG: AAA family ATPase, partial [Spirulina sp. DLM2.Bin59]
AFALIQGIYRWQKTPKPRPFIELAYGYLPLVLGANLAHYLDLGLGEAGRILPVTFATFGMAGNLPVMVADPAVIVFLQGVTLLAGLLFSVILTQKIAKQAWRLLVPQHLSAIALTFSLWTLILP